MPQITLDPEPVDGATVLRAYLADEPLILADLLPRLDAAGLRTLVENRVRLDPAGGRPIYMHRFQVQDRAGRPLDVARDGENLMALLLAVRSGRAASDSLNRLVSRRISIGAPSSVCAPMPATRSRPGSGRAARSGGRSRTIRNRRGCSSGASSRSSATARATPTPRPGSSRASTT
jgi:hypothetical protein